MAMNGGWDVSKGREADRQTERQGEQAMGWNDGPGKCSPPSLPPPPLSFPFPLLRFGLREGGGGGNPEAGRPESAGRVARD